MAKVERDDGETVELLGTLKAQSGVFALGDCSAISERWESLPASGSWVVDVSGPEARYLAGREGLPRETLCDGTERILCESQQQALAAKESVGHVCVSRGIKGVTTTMQSRTASITRARDVCRASGAGMMINEGLAAFVSGARPVEVWATMAEGKVRELRLVLS